MHGRSCMTIEPVYTGTEHIGCLPTRQTLRSPSARCHNVFGESRGGKWEAYLGPFNSVAKGHSRPKGRSHERMSYYASRETSRHRLSRTKLELNLDGDSRSSTCRNECPVYSRPQCGGFVHRLRAKVEHLVGRMPISRCSKPATIKMTNNFRERLS